MNDARTQRSRGESLSAEVDRITPFSADGNAARLFVTTIESVYPTTPLSYFAVFSTDVGNPEVEGGAASYQNGLYIYYALNVGTQVPSPNTRVIAHAVGGRWVFRFDG